jgi:benzoylformate decarboxylase
MTAQQKEAAQTRAVEIGAEKQKKLKAQLEADKLVGDEAPLHASRFMAELAGSLPKDAVIFDEALTCSPELIRYMPSTRPGRFFQTRGGSLGVGIPGALGAKLANPDKTVIGFTGDGGSLYTIQALWTAAHHQIGAKFVICNNQSYMLLELNILHYWEEQGIEEHAFPQPFQLTEPVVDFVRLAQSMGVPGVRVEKPEQIGPAIRQMLGIEGPFLIDLVLTCHVPGAKIACQCGQ